MGNSFFYQQLYNCLGIIVTTLVQTFMQLIEGLLEKDLAKRPIFQSSSTNNYL